MDVHDLNSTERDVLMAMLAHMTEADDHIDPAEMLELHELAEEMGIEDLQADMIRARAVVQTREDLVKAAAKVERPQARELIRTILLDLAQADGDRSGDELEMLEAIMAAWGR